MIIFSKGIQPCLISKGVPLFARAYNARHRATQTSKTHDIPIFPTLMRHMPFYLDHPLEDTPCLILPVGHPEPGAPDDHHGRVLQKHTGSRAGLRYYKPGTGCLLFPSLLHVLTLSDLSQHTILAIYCILIALLSVSTECQLVLH